MSRIFVCYLWALIQWIQSGDEALQRKHLLDEASKLLQKAKENGEDDRKRAEMK